MCRERVCRHGASDPTRMAGLSKQSVHHTTALSSERNEDVAQLTVSFECHGLVGHWVASTHCHDHMLTKQWYPVDICVRYADRCDGDSLVPAEPSCVVVPYRPDLEIHPWGT